ncbi:kynureninase [Salinispirillum sp. LH 10-3-1]|uniref:Kynureninase n=1 Tax=Salinispirillum sp. LH 10-3-1 TaxID=2952525 RepID=A0AB38YKB2_9GAMM
MSDWSTTAAQLQRHYSAFKVSERILLTGHSHQAWPDVAREGQLLAFDHATTHVDDKWAQAFAQADRVRTGFAERLGDTSGEYVLGQNTQELLVRWLSALPLDRKPHLVTTDGEFHSMRRLLARLNETDLTVTRVATEPVDTLAERLWAACTEQTAAVMCSMVLFQTGQVVPHLPNLAQRCQERQLPLLLDAYHLVNALPYDMDTTLPDSTFVVGGGYKYCQLGEGNCFLRVPKSCDWRPLVTGWYAEFAELSQSAGTSVAYGTGRWAFEGSTYDPTSHYRAARVWQFFAEQQLNVATLRSINIAQLTLLRERLSQYHWPTHVELPSQQLAELGGFLVIRTPEAAAWSNQLRSLNVWTDSRGNCLRFGPAPYLTAEQISAAVERLHQVATQTL